MTAPTCGELSCDECNARTAALTAERDQLRQQVANLTYSNNAHRETAETWRAAAIERDQLRADCENETKWAAHYLAQSIADKARAERAEAEAERYRLVTLRLDAELAKERARLDWLMAGGMCLVQHSGGFHVSRLHCQVSRAAIDLGMKEDAE